MTTFVVDKTIQIQRHKQVRSVQAREDPSEKFKAILEGEVERVLDKGIIAQIVGSVTSAAHHAAHAGLIRDYLGILESFPEFARPAAMVVWAQTRRVWMDSVNRLLGAGLLMTINDAALLTERLGAGCTSYLLVERAPLKPSEQWTPVFTKLFINSPIRQKTYALVTDRRTLRYGHLHTAEMEGTGTMVGLDRLTAAVETIKCSGCKFYYLDSDAVEHEGFHSLPPDALEIFDNDVAMRYCLPPEGTFAGESVVVRLVRLADCERALQVMVQMIATHGTSISRAQIQSWRREATTNLAARKP